MFTFDVNRFVPRFILEDKNGYAVAKAIEAAVQYMNNAVLAGVKCIADYDTMPEWRLDELAWELNCLYDFKADLNKKRTWIKNAIPLYRLWGTPQAIYRYISGYFDTVELEEHWVYGGEPYHFRVTVNGEWTPENEAWARKAIATAKNVRSVLDSLMIGHLCRIGIEAEGGVYGRFAYPVTSADNWTGRWPQENTTGVLDETPQQGIEASATGQKFPYPMTGTRPQESTAGVLDETPRQGVEANATGQIFHYPMTGPERMTGLLPQENVTGYIQKVVIPSTQAEDTFGKILYKMCGQDEI